jgi:hypothetical protein
MSYIKITEEPNTHPPTDAWLLLVDAEYHDYSELEVGDYAVIGRAFVDEEDGGFTFCDKEYEDVSATHWMAIPPSPFEGVKND